MGKRSGGRDRLPTAGGIIASVVLLATSAAAPVGPVGAAKAPGNRPAAQDQVAPLGAGDTRWLPHRYQATGAVANVNTGPVMPAVFTGNIPATVLDGYRHARAVTDAAQPGCRLPLELLEAIGKVETNHARNGLVDANGTTLGSIRGPALDGNGFAAIPDTDRGRFDDDPVWDHAVGPMQFLPSTWVNWSADGNGDHRADPNNVYDASLATASYLCAANRDLGTPDGLSEAILSYNDSASYRNLVLAWMSTYANGTTIVPDATVVPVQQPATAMPANNPTSPAPAAPAPAAPPTSAPPAPPAPPVTTLPVTTPPSVPVPGLVCAVTDLVGGLLGALTGAGQPAGCSDPTAASPVGQ
jgi:hypothetical protein